MTKFVINTSICAGCGACIGVCPAGAISIGKEGKAVIDEEKCRGCGRCKEVCPFNAIVEEQEVPREAVSANWHL